MDKQEITQIMFQQFHSSSSYSELEAARVSSVGIATLRHLHALGLIEGIEGMGRQRRYSEEAVEQLRRIRRLQRDLGINLAGIEVIVHLLKRIESLEQALERRKAK